MAPKHRLIPNGLLEQVVDFVLLHNAADAFPLTQVSHHFRAIVRGSFQRQF